MPLTPPFARCVVNFSAIDERPWTNELWFNITGTFPSNWNVSNAAIAMENHLKTNWVAIMNANYRWIGVDLHVNNAGISATGTTYTVTVGTGANSAVPNEVAALMRFQANVPAGSGRGRIYLGGLDSISIDGGRLDPGSLTPFTTLATTLQTSVTDQGVTYHPAVYSRKNAALYNFVYAQIELPLGTQRVRRVRR